MSEIMDPVSAINAMCTPTGFDPNKFQQIRTTLLGIDTICPSPCNPRKHFSDESMAELVDSIKKHGLLEPIIVRLWPSDYAHNPSPLPMYELVAGERRWRAAKAAGMKLIEGKVRDLTDHELLEVMLVENLQREGLHPLEEAEGYEQMVRDYRYTAEAIAEKVGKSKAYVYARMKLTDLCHESRKAFYAGKLNFSTALLVARIPVMRLQEQATREIIDPDWQGDAMSVRAAQLHLQRKYMLRLSEAPFPINDPDLFHSAGKCEFCPKRTGNAPDLFDDVESVDVCTDPDCYDTKRKAHIARESAAAKAKGLKVIIGEEAVKIMPYGKTSDLKSNLVALDQKCRDDKEFRTYREILGENAKPTAVIEDHRSGEMVEAVDKKQLAEAMKAVGVKSGNDLVNKKQLAIDAKVKEEGEFRRRLFARIRKPIHDAVDIAARELATNELALIAQTMFKDMSMERKEKIAKLWGVENEKQDYSAIFKFEKAVADLTRPEATLMLIDLCLIGETTVSAYQIEHKDEQPTRMLTFAQNSGIDLAEIREEIAAEAREKAKAPAKAAQAGSPKRAKKPAAKKAAPAADDTPLVLAPAELPETIEESNENPNGPEALPWPFPTAEKGDEETDERPIQAEPLDQDPEAPARCDRTEDMFSELSL